MKHILNYSKKHECMFEYVKGDFEKIDDNKIEVVGINYYQPLRVRQRETAWNPDKPFIPTAYYETYSPRGIKMKFFQEDGKFILKEFMIC